MFLSQGPVNSFQCIFHHKEAIKGKKYSKNKSQINQEMCEPLIGEENKIQVYNWSLFK